MAIKFLKDYSVGQPAEKFTKGQKVEDRSPESEAHFVRRGAAAYLGPKGVLTDIDGNVVSETEDDVAEVLVVNTSDNRTETSDGTPDRASSGPGVVLTSASIGKGEEHKAGRK